MKRARVFLGTVLISGIVALGLSWPSDVSQYPIKPKTISTLPYNKETHHQTIPTIPYTPPVAAEKVMLALNKIISFDSCKEMSQNQHLRKYKMTN